MNRRAWALAAVAVSSLGMGTLIADDRPGGVTSGLKPGEAPPPFLVDDVTGPNKGTTLCYR